MNEDQAIPRMHTFNEKIEPFSPERNSSKKLPSDEDSMN